MATLGEARNGEARNGTAVKDLTANCYLWRKLMGWTKAHIKYRDALRAEYTSETGKRDYLLPDFEAWLVAREELPPLRIMTKQEPPKKISVVSIKER